MLDQIHQNIFAGLGFLFVLALLISSIGFYRVVYFISIGYAFSITGMALLGLWLWRANLTWASVLQNFVVALWGFRLGFYILRREVKESYRVENKDVQARGAHIGLRLKLMIWISTSFLYVCMFLPGWISLSAQPGTSISWTLSTQIIGAIVILAGFVIETIADQQKSDFKARFSTRFCDVGLYRWVRCPNYLGEIMVWLGNWLMALALYTSLLHWGLSLLGLVCIILIMLGSAKRLESKQGERYGKLPEYQQYIQKVPILFPFLPIYTLQNIKVYLE